MRLCLIEKRRFAIGGSRLSDDRETLRWEGSWALAVGVVIAGALLAVIPAALAPMLDGATVIGLPLPVFLGALIAPLGIVAVLFFFAVSQGQLDRRAGSGGSGD